VLDCTGPTSHAQACVTPRVVTTIVVWMSHVRALPPLDTHGQASRVTRCSTFISYHAGFGPTGSPRGARGRPTTAGYRACTGTDTLAVATADHLPSDARRTCAGTHPERRTPTRCAAHKARNLDTGWIIASYFMTSMRVEERNG
jgi:hypothetical protein